MRKRVDGMSGHVIICGVGRTGHHVVQELRHTRTPFVCIDNDAAKMARLAEEMPEFMYIVGDATEDDVLLGAGIKRARGVVATLTDGGRRITRRTTLTRSHHAIRRSSTADVDWLVPVSAN